MTRALPEWIGKHDDSPVPPRIQLRRFEYFNGICQCGCKRKVMAGEQWQLDHIKALANGGEHRETNLQPLLTEHHKNKTRADIAEKSKTYKRRARHVGIKLSTGRSFPTNKSGPMKKTFYHGTVRR